MTIRSISNSMLAMLTVSMALAVFAPGCGKQDPKAGSSTEGGPQAPVPAQPKPLLVPKTQLADWCGEHGVPESLCTRCNSSLVDGFRAKGDWCSEHGLPKSQCIACDPALKAKLEALAPKADGTKADGTK